MYSWINGNFFVRTRRIKKNYNLTEKIINCLIWLSFMPHLGAKKQNCGSRLRIFWKMIYFFKKEIHIPCKLLNSYPILNSWFSPIWYTKVCMFVLRIIANFHAPLSVWFMQSNSPTFKFSRSCKKSALWIIKFNTPACVCVRLLYLFSFFTLPCRAIYF